MKCTNDILYQFDYPTEDMISVGYIHGKLLVPCEKGKADPLQQAMQVQYKKRFNSFVFVHDELHPMEVYQALKSYLQSSASFAIFSVSLQPLTELLNQMNYDKDSVNAKIEELWTREHQVLPLRTHPHMNMHG